MITAKRYFTGIVIIVIGCSGIYMTGYMDGEQIGLSMLSGAAVSIGYIIGTIPIFKILDK